MLGPALAHAYLHLIQKYPGLWAYLYDNRAIAAAISDLRQFYLFLEGGKLQARIKELAPDVIVCTHAFSFFSIAAEKEQGLLAQPLVAALTDFGAHAYWTRFPAELMILPSEEVLSELAQQGVDRRRLMSVGISIHPVYEAVVSKDEARKALGIDAKGPVVLLSGGSKALGGLDELAEEFLKLAPGPVLLVACGSNAALQEKLASRRDPRLKLYPSLPPHRMKELFCAADILVGKAGGLTCAEALATGLPAVFVHPIPGQEERNVDHLSGHGAALRAASAAQAVRAVAELFADPTALETLARKARALGRPDAARRAAEAILSL